LLFYHIYGDFFAFIARDFSAQNILCFITGFYDVYLVLTIPGQLIGVPIKIKTRQNHPITGLLADFFDF